MGARNVGRTGKMTINGQTFDVHDVKIVESPEDSKAFCTPEPLKNCPIPELSGEFSFFVGRLILRPRQYPPPVSNN